MNMLDIIGPAMVGPSSSHTAGAVRIGRIARKLMAEKIISAKILLHGSFLATGKGHGTDRALVAGLLGMEVDDDRIRISFEVASREGLSFEFGSIMLPNSKERPSAAATSKLIRIRSSSTSIPRRPATRARSVPCPFPVARKEP